MFHCSCSRRRDRSAYRVRCDVHHPALPTAAVARGLLRATEKKIGDVLRSASGGEFHPPRERVARVNLDHVSKSFGETLAVDDVSLSVGAGEIVGLVGEN